MGVRFLGHMVILCFNFLRNLFHFELNFLYGIRSAVITWKHVFTQGEDKGLSQEKHIDIGPLKTPARLKVHTCKPDMSGATESLATISRVNIDILPAERDLSDGLVQESEPTHTDASNELEGKCSISQAKERLQDNTKSSTQPENLIPIWSSNDVTVERNDPVKPLQPLNDQESKDQVSDMHELLVSEGRPLSAVTKVWVVLFSCALVVLGKSTVMCTFKNNRNQRMRRKEFLDPFCALE